MQPASLLPPLCPFPASRSLAASRCCGCLFSTTNSECFVFYLHVTPSWQPTECYRMARGRGGKGVMLLQLHLHICKSLQRRQAMGSACVCVMLHHSCAIVYLVSPNLASMEWVRLSWQEREGGREVGRGVRSGGGWSGRRLECAWYAHSQIKIHIFEFAIRSSWLRSAAAFDERGNCIRICICICSTASASVAKSEQAFCCGG